MTRTLRFVSLLAVPAIVAAIASNAHGHARLMNPAPRDNQDGYKDPPRAPPGNGAPCGISEAASQPHTTLAPGAAITVAWEETVDHPGCFVIDFSPANDANFTVIGRKSHANPPAKTGTPATRKYTLGVTLPTTPCPKCTLRLRQLMLTSDVSEANLATGCPPTTIPSGATYYSCANIVLGSGGASGTGGSAGGTGGATGGGAGGRGGSSAGGRGGTSATAGTSGQAGSGSGAAGTSGQAGDTGTSGQAGTTGQAGDTGTSGQAGTTGQAGDTGTSGQAGTTGQAGNGTSAGAAGTTGSGQAGTSGGGGEATGGCGVAGGAPTPLALLLAIVLLRWPRRRSRS